jgi:hypothetical protein
MMTLINSYNKSIYPLEQKLDIESVSWIKSQKPKYFNLGFNFDNFYNITIELPLPPPSDWYLKKSLSSTIHGVMHLIRVFIHLNILTKNNKITDVEKNSLFLSALIHDIRRQNDRKDKEHGKRASKWFDNNYNVVINRYKNFNKCSKNLVSFIIKYHQDDIVSLKTKFSEREIFILKTFKVADALDRFRLPNSLWWLDKNLVFYPIEEKHILFAFDLVVKSETHYIKSNNWQESINYSLNELKS